MKNEVTSVNIKTESADTYNFLEEREFNTETFIEWLKFEFGDEFAFIAEINIETLGYDKTNIDEKAVHKEIDKALDEYYE